MDDMENNENLSRRRFLKTGLAAMAGALGLCAADAFFVEPARIEITRPVIEIDELPPEFDGFRIAHMTDFHHSGAVGLDYIAKVIDIANRESPDLIALTGDYVTGGESYIGPVMDAISELRAPHGFLAVLGNHDHWVNPGMSHELLTAAGAKIVTNRHVMIDRGDSRLCVGGVGDYWEDEQSIGAALAGVPEDVPRIMLSHNPDYAEVMPAGYRVDLMLSGHTHGGQFVLPVVGAPVVPSRYGNKYRAGLVRGPRCRVYVSRGIGLIRPAVRFNCRPEIAIITLKTTAADTT